MYKKVFIIGPALEGNENIINLYKTQGYQVIGDGKRDLNNEDWESLKGNIDSSTKIQILMHGGPKFGNLHLCPGPYSYEGGVKAKDIWQSLKIASNGAPLQVDLHCCYVGSGINSVTALPEGSILKLYRPKNYCLLGSNIESIIKENFELDNSGTPFQDFLNNFAGNLVNHGASIAVNVNGKCKSITFTPESKDLKPSPKEYLCDASKQLIDFFKSTQLTLDNPQNTELYQRILENDGVSFGDISELNEIINFSYIDTEKYKYFSGELEQNSFSQEDISNMLAKLFFFAISFDLDEANDIANSFFNKEEINSNINKKDGNGYACLHKEAYFGNLEAVKFLVEAGANMFAKDSRGYTALDLANMNEKSEVSHYLEYKMASNFPDFNEHSLVSTYDALIAGYME